MGLECILLYQQMCIFIEVRRMKLKILYESRYVKYNFDINDAYEERILVYVLFVILFISLWFNFLNTFAKLETMPEIIAVLLVPQI
jgi:hypothetical protein